MFENNIIYSRQSQATQNLKSQIYNLLVSHHCRVLLGGQRLLGTGPSPAGSRDQMFRDQSASPPTTILLQLQQEQEQQQQQLLLLLLLQLLEPGWSAARLGWLKFRAFQTMAFGSLQFVVVETPKISAVQRFFCAHGASGCDSMVLGNFYISPTLKQEFN